MAFTVEFNDEGTITRVFKGPATSLGDPVQPGPPLTTGRPVRDVTSVTIVTTSNPTTCINQGGVWYCFTR